MDVFPKIQATKSTAFLHKLIVFQPAKKFPAFYGTRMFISVFTKAFQCFLS